MKVATVREVKDNLSKFLEKAKKEEIVITRNGHPTAILHAFHDEDELEDYLLEHDPNFIRKIEKRWQNYQKEGGIPLPRVSKA